MIHEYVEFMGRPSAIRAMARVLDNICIPYYTHMTNGVHRLVTAGKEYSDDIIHAVEQQRKLINPATEKPYGPVAITFLITDE